MNLNQDPTVEQLRCLLAAADDEAAHHVLWVDEDGGVHLDALRADEHPPQFVERMQGRVRLRHETFARGNGYVGPEAARATGHVERVFTWLTSCWRDGVRGYRDF